MEGHKFRVGQRVLYDPPRRTTGSAVFTVVRLLPPEGGERTYRIKSTEENFERAAKERELTSSA
ncbi:MAG: hypothetical protein IT540_05715 [Hyphomicrobium sp.]|nr:hypothetical protein [Hyphomicrobium sp.]